MTTERVPAVAGGSGPGLSASHRAALARLHRDREAALGTPAFNEQALAVEVRPDGGGPTFLCPPPVSGSAYWSLPLSRMLPAGHKIVALTAPGLNDGEPVSSVPELATTFLRVAAAGDFPRPYLLAGYSMGATVAYEMARQLMMAGEPPGMLIMIDPDAPAPRFRSDQRQRMHQFMHDISRTVDRPMPPMPPEDLPPETTLVAAHSLMQEAGLVPEGIDSSFVARRFRVFDAHITALERYDAPDYAGSACIISTAGSDDCASGWAERIGGPLCRREIPGDHYTMWAAQHREELTAVLRELTSGELP